MPPAWKTSLAARSAPVFTWRLRSATSAARLMPTLGLPAAASALMRSACASALVSYRLNVSPVSFARYPFAKPAASCRYDDALRPSACDANASSAAPNSMSSRQVLSG